MGLANILNTMMYGTFRCDWCGHPHPRRKQIWSNRAYPGFEFGSKKCLIKFERMKREELKRKKGQWNK